MKNTPSSLGSIVVPMVTPFLPNGGVNYDLAAEMVDYLIENRMTDSIAVSGTTGEFNTLSFDERIQLFRVVKDAAHGRVPLVAGTGAASTRETVALTQEAARLGYDVALVVGPYYCKPTQNAILGHYSEVSRVGLPVMVYNIPIFTGTNIAPDTLGKIAALPAIYAVKDEAGINPTQMTDYARACPPGFVIYNGDDIMVLCGLAQGAAGVVSGASFLLGDQMRQMIEHFNAGQIDDARKLHHKFDPFFKDFGSNGRINPIPLLRAAIELAGHPVGPARMPLDAATDEERELMRQHLIRLGIALR